MVVNVLGVRDNGERPGVGVPPAPYRRLQVRMGEDTTIRVEVLEKSGAPVVLASGPVVISFLVRDKPGSFGDKKIEKTATRRPDLGVNIADVVISATDTKRIEGQGTRFVWDLWATDGGQRSALIPTSPFVIAQSVQLP
jgi:hypothetical protein